MWKENLYQPVEILLREHDDFPIGEHQHSFFEMAYILEGKGEFSVHDWNSETEHYSYETNDLFLIPPDTPHVFTIHTHSRYLFIRFTPNYATDYISSPIEKSLEIQSKFRIELPSPEAKTVSQLMQMISYEITTQRKLSETLLQHYVNCIILICSRNLSDAAPDPDKTYHDKALYMLQYIQQHIHQPELLKLDTLAEKFHLSPTYAGRFFKRNFGEDFTQYVAKIKLRKVEYMLTHTHLSIKEIAAQTGYTDSSYLNRIFIRQHGMTPLQFRKDFLLKH